MKIIKFGNSGLDVKIDIGVDGKEDVWLDQESIAKLFKRDKSVITRHIQNIYKNKELGNKTFRSIEKTYEIGKNKGKTYKINEYNLDAILSVGYKINGKTGTEFRKWASKILGEYLTKGYVINEKAMLGKGMNEVVVLLNNCERTLKETRKGEVSELEEVLNIIKKYGESFTSLQNYDSQNFTMPGTQKDVKYILTYEDTIKYIEIFKKLLIEKGEATIMFGNEKSKGALSGIIHTIFSSFFGNDAYEYLEEKASQLLYMIVKDHPFNDGNKRIASFLFVTFLDKNNFLYKKDGTKKVSDEALTFLTVLIAQSHPSERDVLVKMLINTIRGGR